MRALALLLVLASIPSIPALAAAQERCTEISIVSPTPRREAARAARSCTGCDDEGRATITYRLDREVPCGRFVDGSPWVAVGDGANLVGLTPQVTDDCGAGTCNGWMVDIASRNQAFDARSSFAAGEAPAIRNPSDAEPFALAPGNAVVKAVSFQDEVVGANCSARDVLGSEPRHCLYFVGALTVLRDPPPDGTGAGYFRPPYVGTERPLIPVSDARLDRLPRLPLEGVTGLPDRDVAEQALCQLPVEYMGTYRQQYFKGYLNVGEARGYHGYVSRELGDWLLRALFEDRTDRMAACLVQRGIDLHHMLLEPVATSWGANGGHGQGRTTWPYLAAALLGRDDWRAAMDAMSPGRFAERSQVYWSPVADPDGARGGVGEVLYGAYPGAGGISMCTVGEYLGRCYPDWPGSCNRVCGDPFGFIDGGSPGGSYQEIFSPAARAFVLTAHLVPDLLAAWPRDDGHPLMIEYTDRWVECGAWTAHDPCDAADPLDPSSPDDCTSGPPGTCVCRPGSGRYADRHCTNADGGSAYKTAFTTEVWSRFRACASDCSCAGMEGLCDPPVTTDPDAGAPPVGSDAAAPGVDAASPTPDGGSPPDGEELAGGCGCRAAGSGAPPWLALAALALVGLRRRR